MEGVGPDGYEGRPARAGQVQQRQHVHGRVEG